MRTETMHQAMDHWNYSDIPWAWVLSGVTTLVLCPDERTRAWRRAYESVSNRPAHT